jgi:hypothetical protein
MTARGGFTAVNRGTLEHGLPVHQNTLRLNANQVRSAPALGRVTANPTRAAMLGPNAGRPAAVAPSSAVSRPVVSHMTPPAASRTAFNSGTRATAAPTTGAQGNRPTGPATAQSANTARPNGSSTNPSATSQAARPSAYSHGQYVPRPPQAAANNSGAAANNSASNSRVSNGSMPAARNVPRPPTSAGTSNGTRSSQPVQSATNRAPMNMNQTPSNQSIPRPQQGTVRQSSPSPYFGRSGSSGGSNNVPRPTGPVQPAPRNYSSPGSSGYSRSYGQGSGGYGPRGYSAPQNGQSYGQSQRYSGSPYSSPYSGRSYSSPYQGGRSYSAPSYSAPNYGGRSYGGGSGGGYSAPAPSRGGSPSFGGGGGSRGSSSGGGGSRPSGGAGRSGGHR